MIETIEKPVFISSDEWKKKGTYHEVLGKEFFVIDEGKQKKCLVILHSYFSSSYDYYKVIDELSQKYRVIIPDLINFGSSEVVSENYFSIVDQTDYLVSLLESFDLTEISVLGHDYGIAIAQELLARQNGDLLPFKIVDFTYCNGNLPINNSYFLDNKESLKKDIAGKMTGMLTVYGIFKKTVKNILFEDKNISDDELLEMWKQLESNNGRSIIKFIYDYLRERKIFWNRWTSSLINTTIPVKIVWGSKDKPTEDNYPDALAYKVEFSDVSWIEKSGHYPMLENPKEFINCILH